jgi:SAM-dependent methyltransferase
VEMPLPHICSPLHLDAPTFTQLLSLQGPSLGLWRAAEVAALREQQFERPVLDLGCGDGLVTSMVLPHVEVGVDPDARALARHRKPIYEQILPCRIEEAGLAEGTFATVVSNSVLEHVPQIETVLQTAGRLLRPGGRLIFTTPTDAFSRWLALPIARYAAWRNQGYGHLNLWPASYWARLLQQVGLQVEVVRPLLRHALVTAWDVLDVAQRPVVSGKPIAGRLWRRMPAAGIGRLGHWGSRLDLSANKCGGGQLIVARKAAT